MATTPFLLKLKMGLSIFQHSGDDNAPIATCEQRMARLFIKSSHMPSLYGPVEVQKHAKEHSDNCVRSYCYFGEVVVFFFFFSVVEVVVII
jgi:hypothetical protein